MLVSKKIRLEASEQDAATLEFMQGKCRALYNWWVMCQRNGKRWSGWKAARKTLQASKEHDPELKWVNEHDRSYYIGGFKGNRWYNNKQLDTIRSKRDNCGKCTNALLFRNAINIKTVCIKHLERQLPQ
jgi:hypothetical protein